MIRTQLCPLGELENKNWWYIDAAFLMAMVVVLYMFVGVILDEKREETQVLITKKAKWEQDLEAKKPALEKFKTLNEEMDMLNRKIGALKKITTSKLDKVKPLVALDQLQTLWLDGVWYESLEYSVDGITKIRGAALDSMLIGEYMLGVRESMNLETKNDDLRTQIGFADVSIKSARYNEGADEFFRDVSNKMSFDLTAKHTEKAGANMPPTSMMPRPRAKGSSSF